MIPSVSNVSREGKEAMDLVSFQFAHKRYIYLFSEIDDEAALHVIAQLEYLSEGGNEPVILWINSPGGSVSAGLAIVDAMKRVRCDVITVCTGLAASMAAFIVACGTRRYITPYAEMMLHQPLGKAVGQATDIERTASHIARTKKALYTLLAEHTGKSIDAIAADCDRDFYLSADEAVEYGLVDQCLCCSGELNASS